MYYTRYIRLILPVLQMFHACYLFY